MADEPANGREGVAFRTLWWTRLFRGVGVSFDARKLILAALGLAALSAGWMGLDWLLEGSEAVASRIHPRLGELSAADPLSSLAAAARRVADPVVVLSTPFVELFSVGQGPLWLLRSALLALWSAVVWGIVGGAIARIAVVDLARGERVGIGSALKFALARWLPLIGTPLCPLIGIGFFGALCALMGLLYRIPSPVGASAAGILAFLPLLAGLVMTMIAAGLAVGWPLMILTVAAEGEDTFDALSRSYSYVYQRPGRYAVLAIVAWVIGTFGVLLVTIFAAAVVQLTMWGLSISAPDALVLRLFQQTATPETTAEAIHDFWLSVVGLLAYGWVFSYFWTASAIVYLILRHDVDGASWDDIYMPGQDADPFAPEPDGAIADATNPEAGPIKPQSVPSEPDSAEVQNSGAASG